MKREIKFRGLRRDGLGWAYGWLCPDKDGDLNIITEQPWQPIFRFKVHPETVGQFTGCRDYSPIDDCSKSDIYEGDRCTFRGMQPNQPHEGREGVVKFCEGAFWLDFGDDAVPVWSDAYYLEITGNIHKK